MGLVRNVRVKTGSRMDLVRKDRVKTGSRMGFVRSVGIKAVSPSRVGQSNVTSTYTSYSNKNVQIVSFQKSGIIQDKATIYFENIGKCL